MELGLTDTRALVTAASSGLGLACATSLAREGSRVVVSARVGDRLEAAREASDASAAVPCDLESATQIDALMDQSVTRLGGLDILVVNCGPPPVGLFADMADKDWEQAFVGVTLSAVRLIRAALPALRASTRGRIVVLTGYGMREPQSNLVVSEANRSGVALIAKVVAGDHARSGLTVNNIAPGPVLTDRLRDVHRAAAERRGGGVEEVLREAALAVPVGRFGEAGEIGDLCAYLCSDLAGFITGQTIVVDGGINRAV